MKKWFLIFILLGTSFIAFGERYKELELFSHVLNFVESRYFQPVTTKKLIHGAIKGMLSELDSHSHFFTPDESTAFKNQAQDKAFMLGMEIDKKNGDFVVISILKNSPAQKAGLQPGDKIVGFNGKKTKGFSLEAFYQKLQTKFQKEFMVLRSGSTKPLKIKIRPGMVKLRSVQYKLLKDDYLYLKIYQFSFSAFFQINKALRKYPKKKGLLMDLRGNPGGVFEQVIKVADLFLGEGVIVYYKERNQKRKAFSAHKASTLDVFPIVVLIDEYSASGSEILAGALKDHQRALIVGRKSFGKGSVQSFFQMGKGYALKLTVGEYRTPSDYSIQKEGITPHIILSKKESSKETKDKPKEDKELEEAFEILKNFQKFKKTHLSKT